jgi:hypothetical protein
VILIAQILEVEMRDRQVAGIPLVGREDRREPIATFTRLKIAVFAPMPRASESTATAVNAGLFTSIRRP